MATASRVVRRVVVVRARRENGLYVLVWLFDRRSRSRGSYLWRKCGTR